MKPDESLSLEHIEFLNKLVEVPRNISVITKFIRGNGRIRHINRYTNPNHSIVVVRSVYDVIRSLGKCRWDFFSNPLNDNKENWKNFINEIDTDYLELDTSILNDVRSSSDWYTRNAFYWYVMNLAALKCADEHVSVVRYEELSEVGKLIDRILPELNTSEEKINNSKFRGENIHSNYPLKYQRKIPFLRKYKKLYYYWQYLRYNGEDKGENVWPNISTFYHFVNRAFDFHPHKFGDILIYPNNQSLEKNDQLITKSSRSSNDYSFSNSLIDFFSEDINAHLSNYDLVK